MHPYIHDCTDIRPKPDMLWADRPVQARTSTDLMWSCQTMQMLQDGQPTAVGTFYGNVLALLLTHGAPVGLQSSDIWLRDTLNVIRSHRHFGEGWDGERAAAPVEGSLSAAEMLSAFLAVAPDNRRPQLSVGPDGLASFARKLPNFYLHLVVEPPSSTEDERAIAQLTWLSVKDGAEEFIEGVPFDGRTLPQALRAVVEVE